MEASLLPKLRIFVLLPYTFDTIEALAKAIDTFRDHD